MTTTTKPKIQVQAFFDLVVEQCRKVRGFDASSAELAIMRKAFDGMFDKAQTRTRKTPLSWCGYVRQDGTIDEAARLQCLQSAFCRLMHYHLGRNGAYLGTLINAFENLKSCYEAFDLIPNPRVAKWWELPSDSPILEVTRRLTQENQDACRHFADVCDTFAQVFVFINKKGQTSSVPGDEWRKALGI
jgi:hypothetical protein